jgi:hypothetical protein
MAISLIVPAASAEPTRSDPTQDFLGPPLPDKTLISADRDVTISWQVRTSAGDIRFRIYRGPDSHSLELVREEPASPGIQRYQYTDVLDLFGPVWYELRFVTPAGLEVSLASMLYLVPTLGPGDEEVAWPSTDYATVAALPLAEAPGSHPRNDWNPPVSTGFKPEPMKPPPKA